jgi:hypothetical protein
MNHRLLLAGFLLVIGLGYAQKAHLVWQQRYDSGRGDFGSSVAADGRDIIVGGICRDTPAEPSGTAWELLRYDQGGKLLWHRTYDRGRRDSLAAIAVAPNHDIAGVGCSASNTADTVRLLLARFSAQGEKKWEKEYAFGPATRGSALCLDSTGRIAVCGSVNSGDTLAGSDILFARFDSMGSLYDRETLDFGSDEFGQSLIRSYSGTVTIVAGTRAPCPGEPDSLAAQDIVSAGLGPDGKVSWRQRYGSGRIDFRACLSWPDNLFQAVTARDTVGTFTRVVEYGPYSTRPEPSLRDMRYPDTSSAVCMAVVGIRGSGILGVGSEGVEGNRRCLVWRCFRGKFSTILPGSQYPPGTNEQANAVALDSDGNAVMTGVSGSEAQTGILTVKVALPHYRSPPDILYPRLWSSH